MTAGGARANGAKREMARSVVALYHGPRAAEQAEERFDAVFKRHELPDDIPEFGVPDGDSIHLPALLVASGLAGSTSAARRDINAGAVRIDSVAVAAGDLDMSRTALVGHVLACGKRRMVRLV